MEKMNAYQLARTADCADPETLESPGAEWLHSVAASVDEIVAIKRDGSDYWQDSVAETADMLVPIYNHRRWQVFVDLAAWQEDISDYGGVEGDMTAAAGVALYAIAERLLYALVEMAEDDDDQD